MSVNYNGEQQINYSQINEKIKSNTNTETESLTNVVTNTLKIYDTKTIQPNITVAKDHHTLAKLGYNWNELIPSKLIIKMESNACNIQEDPLFIIHPVEGEVTCLQQLVKEIKMPVYGLQCTEQVPLTSINELAKFYIEQIRLIQPKGPYVICGYSYGAIIAFEMSLQLEKMNEIVSLIQLDGSPKYVVEQIDKRIAKFGDLQNGVLINFMLYFKDTNYTKMIEELSAICNWNDKLNKVAEILSNITSFSTDQLKLAADNYYTRVIAACNYKTSDKFKGKIILIRIKNSLVKIEDDYELSLVCEQKVAVEKMEGNHFNIILKPIAYKVADIIHTFVGRK